MALKQQAYGTETLSRTSSVQDQHRFELCLTGSSQMSASL